jgi:hypothetical protein
MWWWWLGALLGGVLGVAVAIPFGVRYVRTRRVRSSDALLARARTVFHWRREWLEARFLSLAAQSGRPRGLNWTNCDFENPVAFARDRHNGELRALVGCTISFEAVPGGGMENVEAVSNLRAATAVFRFNGHDWETDGRAVFNLSPRETIRHYRHELEMVE